MSLRSERDEDEGKSVLDIFRDWYQVPVLALIVTFMLQIRLSSFSNFVRGDEVLFSGNDAWYHLREVNYAVRNWPSTMPFDPWTNFPLGTSVGQFGTLYDQLVATAALVVGLGSPSDALIAKTLLVTPAVFGALAAIPVYYLGKRFGGRVPGLFGAFILMLLPGTFLTRTLAGVADHNAAEPFFHAVAVVALVSAFSIAEREKPVWELVEARDWTALSRTAQWSTLAGIATAVYMWVWPPGVLLLGVVGLFLLVKFSSDVYNGRSPEPVAFAGSISMSVTAFLLVVRIDTLGFSVTQFSLVQPVFAVLVGGGSVFLALLARQWDQRDIDDSLYPGAVLGLLVVSLTIMAIVLPDLFGQIRNNFYRTLAFSANAATRTIAEAQPFLSPSIRRGLSPTGMILSEYGVAFFTAVAAAVWMLAKPLLKDGEREHLAVLGGGTAIIAVIFAAPAVHSTIADAIGMDQQVFALFVVAAIIAVAAHVSEHDATTLFVITWAAFITAAAFTQVRFNYYLAVVVAVLNAYFIAEILRYVDLDSAIESFDDVETYQVISVALAVMVVLMPVLVIPIGLGPQGSASTATAWQTAGGNGPGAITQWDGSLDWLRNETPDQGNYAGAGNQMAYYGTYERTNDYSYPEGAYGVMSWWDYGHWITVEGQRAPNANPFQQGATNAANYLLAPNSTQAQQVLDNRAEDSETTRYVMIDSLMVSTNSKFGAPVTFYDAENVSRSDFFSPMYQSRNGQIQRLGFNTREQRYYESQMIRLYMYHGSAMEPQPIVTDWQMTQVELRGGGSTFLRTVPRDGQVIKQFQSMEAARSYVQNDSTFEGEPTSQVGGMDKFPEERVEALDHYRLVKASESSQQFTVTQEQYPYVKTFEKVPGATVEGSGAPADTTVRASVQLRIPANNETFTYTQQVQTDENGEFTMTVPYSTTGYEDFGPENGYTNVSVRATGQYSFSTQPQVGENSTVITYRAEADIGEAKVVGADDSPAEITLERTERNLTLQRSSGSGGGSASGLAGDHPREGSQSATTDSVDGAVTLAASTEARAADA